MRTDTLLGSQLENTILKSMVFGATINDEEKLKLGGSSQTQSTVDIDVSSPD